MKILLISKEWPGASNSGVSLISKLHLEILMKAKHEVLVMGSDESVLSLPVKSSDKFCVTALGSGALYSRVKIDRSKLRAQIRDINPDLVVIESWQTAITDSAIEAAHSLGLKVMMISHGVSVHPFSHSLIDVLRSLGWMIYRFFKLPRLISYLSLITTLDMFSESNRFYDRKLALKQGVKVLPLVNCPINFDSELINSSLIKRKRQILVVGYFSPVKNQIEAIKILSNLPDNISLKFIGGKKGSYYKKCARLVTKLELSKRVLFLEDTECSIATEIANSLVLLSTSITEVMPLVLLEAMALGTPFVASELGAIKSLNSGIVVKNKKERIAALSKLIEDKEYWRKMSEQGIAAIQETFSRELVEKQLLNCIDIINK